MKYYRKELYFNTASKIEFINITPLINNCLKESGIKEGLVLVNPMHITASVFINDDDEHGLTKDFDTPTGYRLLVGKPESGKALENFTLHLYKEDGKIRLKMVKGDENKDLDITTLVKELDPRAGKHIETILSSVTNAVSREKVSNPDNRQ